MFQDESGSTEPNDTPPARVGRPRDDTVEERVLPVVRQMLVEVGWNDLSVRAVSARSGVGRATMNRRWNSKAELVLDALLGDLPDLDNLVGRTSSQWVDEIITVSRGLFRQPEFRSALPGLLSSFDQDPVLRDKIWERFALPATTLAANGAHDAPDPLDAAAILVIAAGAALFAAVVPVDVTAIDDRIYSLLHRLGDNT